ncbi:MAG: NUDIX domain-containing protein [Bacilli bacterium]|nr:NUDIX domain-containing protein [Bacilli bacterium]
MPRISGRAIIFNNDDVILLFRHKKTDTGIKEYYAIPGGGQDEGETIEECVIRELKEEYNVDIKINKYLGEVGDDKALGHIYYCEIINGTPKLGGEELERNNEDNYYEIQYININDLDKYEILEENKKLIREAYKLKEGK